MAKLTPIESAQTLALEGKIDAAALRLQSLKSQGQLAACSALAEIWGYRGQWSNVFQEVSCAFSEPDTIENLSVYSDLAMLAVRAAEELNEWRSVGALADAAAKALGSEPSNQTRKSVIQRLVECSKLRSIGPLIIQSTDSESIRKEKFDLGIKKMAQSKMKFTCEANRLDHIYGLARAYQYFKGALSIWEQEKKLPQLFANAVFLARSLLLAGRSDEAWRVLSAAIVSWWPVAATQIAPVVLIVDPTIVKIMTHDRCEEILRKTRGPTVP